MRWIAKLTIRLVIAALGLGLVCAPAGHAQAKYPAKPIQVQVVFPAGGPSDTEARIMCKHAEKVLEQRLIIQNVAGAGGVAGWNNMRGAEKDGYWLSGYNIPHIFSQPLVVKEANFTKDDFTPIIHWANDPTVFAVRADSPYKTIEELIADAKAKPDTVTLGLAGRFLGHHLAVLQLEDAAQVQIKEIPFQGSAPSIAAMLGGQTKGVSDNLSDMLRQGDKVRVLAIATTARHPMAPNVPTFAEKGYPQVVMSSDRGIAAPKGVSPEIVKVLTAAFWKAAQTPEFLEDMKKAGVDVAVMKEADLLKYWAATEVRIRELLVRLKLVEK
jgi:tripartite-type tricarboxylate transporter receptor subunit TctC